MRKQILSIFLVLFIAQATIAQSFTFERQILGSSDDAEEKFNGSYVSTSSSDLEIMYDSWNSQGLQTIGLRFDNVSIPANSVISNAYIQFTANGSSTGDITITIAGEHLANAATFANSVNNISGRTLTSTSTTWDITTAWSEGQTGSNQRTPDLTPIVSEIITSNGWQNGNPIAFVLSGTGSDTEKRTAYSYDQDPSKSAKLVIEYASQSDVDLALISVVQPNANNYPNAASIVEVEIMSYGNLAASGYDVTYSIDGNLVATEPGTVALTTGQTTVFTFAQTADLSLLGSYLLEAEVVIANDEDLSNNSMSQTVNVITEVEDIFFSAGSSWRYWDISSSPGNTWKTVAYDDQDWPVGVGQFGFGEGDEQTVVNGGIVSYYFRKTITVQDATLLNELYLHMAHDDGAIVYINGVELFRTELIPEGAISHFSSAKQSNNDDTENDFYTYKIDPSNFVTGENTIAISVRNKNSTDDDLSFDGYFTPNFTYSQDGPYVSYNGSDIIVEEVTPGGLVTNTYTSATGLQLTCELPHMNTSFSFELKPTITIEPSSYASTPSKFLTISDFDGHIEGFTMVLKGEGIIDENFNWTYGDGHLIVSGDLFDRGFHITECMWLLYKLETEAEAAGGKVHLIIGNHEMMNLTDDWRYVEVKYFNNAHLMGKRMLELYDNNTELGRWLRSKNIIEKIGDYAFMHGGYSPEVEALNLTLDEINDYGRLEMDEACPNSICDIVNGSDGIYWYRGMAEEELTQQVVDDLVDSLGVLRVVFGHTKDNSNSPHELYNGRVLAIDLWHMSNFANGYMEALQFELGCFYIFHTDDLNHTYTSLGTCDSFSNNVIEINGVGQLQIYPNPTANSINIRLPQDLQSDYQYTIMSMEGKVINRGKINTELTAIDVSHYVAGRYVITLRDKEKVIAGHFVLME